MPLTRATVVRICPTWTFLKDLDEIFKKNQTSKKNSTPLTPYPPSTPLKSVIFRKNEGYIFGV